ncbi:proline racemase family protein [Amylibacter sp.]|nr:proline racemase family protein [Amylibacter sp.]
MSWEVVLMRFSRMIQSVEVHAEGEPGRVITGGMPQLKGDSVYEKMRYMEAHHDDLRLKMLREPRGYPVLCCNALVEPCDPRADAGFIIMEQTEYPPMSGSNTICVVTTLLETGILPMVEPVTELTLEAPAGLLKVRAECSGGKVTKVAFRNVPAFAVHLDAEVEIPHFGKAVIDVAWGGMFFAIADAAQFGIELGPQNEREQVRFAEMIRQAAVEQLPVVHPENAGITGPTIGQLTGSARRSDANGASAVSVSTGAFDWDQPQMAPGVFDRSPCGTGTCAKMAVLHAKGVLSVGDRYLNEGPLGTIFEGRILEEATVGPYSAIVPEIAGQGWIYGMSQWIVDPSDPFQDGYTIGDIWG